MTGTAGQVAGAFSLGFKRVQLPSGRVAFANTKAPQFNGSVASLIGGVLGLNSLSIPHPLNLQAPRLARAHVSTAPARRVTGGPALHDGVEYRAGLGDGDKSR